MLPPPIPLAYYAELPPELRSLHVFLGVGHYPNAEVPDRLAGTIRRFLVAKLG